MDVELSVEAAGTSWGMCCNKAKAERWGAGHCRRGGPQPCWLLDKPESVTIPLWVLTHPRVQCTRFFPMPVPRSNLWLLLQAVRNAPSPHPHNCPRVDGGQIVRAAGLCLLLT